MEATITRYEALKQIQTGDPFDLVFITADRRRGTGGKIKRLHNVVKIMPGDEEKTPVQTRFSTSLTSRDPNHFHHRTFNVYNPSKPAEHAHKVHWRLMVFFNGKRIVQ